MSLVLSGDVGEQKNERQQRRRTDGDQQKVVGNLSGGERGRLA